MVFDAVLSRFLHNSWKQAQLLQADSDILRILPINQVAYAAAAADDPPSHFLLRFKNMQFFSLDPDSGLVIQQSGPLDAAVNFPADYLKSLDPALYLKMIAVMQRHFFHPNVNSEIGCVCLGRHLAAGSTLSEIILHVYDILSYRNMQLDEHDALNPMACRYFRDHPDLHLSVPSLRRKKLKAAVRLRSDKQGS